MFRIVLLIVIWQSAVASNEFGAKQFEDVLRGSWPRVPVDDSVRDLCGGACMSASLHLPLPPKYLLPITEALRKAQETKRLVVAMVGDSVGLGGSAPKGQGFFDGLGAYMKQMPELRGVQVEVKNLSRGGQGTYSLFMCSGLTVSSHLMLSSWQ